MITELPKDARQCSLSGVYITPDAKVFKAGKNGFREVTVKADKRGPGKFYKYDLVSAAWCDLKATAFLGSYKVDLSAAATIYEKVMGSKLPEESYKNFTIFILSSRKFQQRVIFALLTVRP